jgi:hypothetical protein
MRHSRRKRGATARLDLRNTAASPRPDRPLCRNLSLAASRSTVENSGKSLIHRGLCAKWKISPLKRPLRRRSPNTARSSHSGRDADLAGPNQRVSIDRFLFNNRSNPLLHRTRLSLRQVAAPRCEFHRRAAWFQLLYFHI